jgi:putative intracellular protease/amidase
LAKVLIPLPRRDFDPSEVALSWQVLRAGGHEVAFATPEGVAAEADPIMLSGRGLDAWSPLPVLGQLKLFGLILRARADARQAYRAMQEDATFRSPLRWDAVNADDFDGLLLGGGHWARGMREFLESPTLQALVADFFAADKPVAAICHGVLLAARSRRADGLSVLHGRKTTALTWKQERSASTLAHIGRFWDRNYYRTYPEQPGQAAGYMSVQQEVTRALAAPEDFLDVPPGTDHFLRKTLGLHRDSVADARPAWVVRDGKYVSARWPGDAYHFAATFARLLESEPDE